MKRYLATFLAIVLLLTGLTVIASAEGWKKETMQDWEYWTYVKADGSLACDEWLQIGGIWYYFDTTILAQSTTIYDNGEAYLMGESGAWTGVKTNKAGWVQKGGNWYYAHDDWGDPWFVVNEPYRFEDGTWYGFDKNGKMAVNGWYWEDDGDDYKYWYYAGSNGVLTKGWKQIDGTWYFFLNGEYNYPLMARDGVRTINEKRYAFEESGALVMNKWYQETWVDWETGELYKGNWYHASASGVLDTGWFKDGGKWYYLDKDYGYMYDWGFQDIDGKIYFFDEDAGYMYQNKWYGYVSDWGDQGTQTDWYYFGEDGAMATGWFQSGGQWYWADDWGTVMFGIMDIDGKHYYLDPDSYALKTGWIKDGDMWFYGKADGSLAWNETVKINGVDYTFGDNGALVEK